MEDLKSRQLRLQEIAKSLQNRLDGIKNGEKIPDEVIEDMRHEWRTTLTHTQAVLKSAEVYPHYYDIFYSNNPYNLQR